jgi:hypothetical protein
LAGIPGRTAKHQFKDNGDTGGIGDIGGIHQPEYLPGKYRRFNGSGRIARNLPRLLGQIHSLTGICPADMEFISTLRGD